MDSGLSIPIPGLGETFKIPSSMLSTASSTWKPGPNGMSKAKKDAAKAQKKLLKKLRKRGKQHS